MKNNKYSVYIIAEIGINHNGSLDNCFRMIDSASAAGCDAAKFQLFKAKRLYPKSAGRLDWKDSNKPYSYDIYRAVEKFETPVQWLDELIKHCNKKKIDFLCSVTDKFFLDVLASKGLTTVKMSSYSVTNIPLLEYCAKKGFSIILSTGGATLKEVEEAVSAITKYHKRLSLLHCSICYPTELKKCNMGVIDALRSNFPDINIGYSDHTKEVSAAAVQAVYLGAKIIEKHITLDKNMKGPDHFFALEPAELKDMVKCIRDAEEIMVKKDKRFIDKTIYGTSAKVAYPHEKYLKDFAFMRLFAKRDIKKGDRIKYSDISILRPGKKERGLEPKDIELFRNNVITARKAIKAEDPITRSNIIK